MVLLIAIAERREDCAQAIRKTTGEVVRLASGWDSARSELRQHSFTAVIIEELLWDSDSRLRDAVHDHCGAAALLVLNLAICGANRVTAETMATLRRHAAEVRHARAEAERQLRGELSEAVTGILLSAELALKTPELPHRAESKIRAVYDLAMGIRERLGGTV